MGSKRRVVNFSNRFINLGVSVLLKWSRSSCHAFGPSPLQSFVSIRILRLSRHCTKYAQILVIRASICSIQHVQQLFRETEPLESLLPHSEVFFLARELEILQRSIHPSQTPTKARNRQKEVTETKMRAAKQGFPRREATKLAKAKRR